jgi:type IV secretory pathway component VirB8
MADDDWYEDGEAVREAERARRVAWIGMSVVTGLFGAVVLTVAAVGLAVILALACAMAVMD